MMFNAADHFRLNQKALVAKDHERQKWFIASREQKRIKEQRIEQAEEAALDIVTAAVLADPVQVAEFRVKLDTYDEATVKALMENQALLDAVQMQIDDMLAQAHMIEDGRRVFKTVDGTQVYDEHGVAVSEQIVHPNEIPDHLPRWEPYRDVTVQKSSLEEERDAILEFQEKLDHARERSDAKDLTQEELDDLESDLADSAPASVAKHMPGFEEKADLKLREDFRAPSASPANNGPSQSGPSAPAL